MRLGSLFLTLPTRVLTGQQIMSSEGQGASSALSWGTSAGCSPSHTGHVSGFKPRACSSAQSSFGVVVMMVKLRILSPAGERQVFHNPAMPISR
jgi:hypothetical protein